MKVLVVNSNAELLPSPVVPLGACLAATAAAEAGHEVAFLDLAFEKTPKEALEREIERFRPDVAGVSIRNIDNTDALTPKNYLPSIRDLVVAPCLKALPERTVLGGPGFSTMPEEILAFMGAPAGVIGDAEASFPALLERWAKGESLAGLPGIVRREGAGTVREEGTRLPADLALQARARRWVDLKRYGRYGGYGNLQTKRGCPLHCTYCVYNRVEGRSYRLRPPEAVVAELKDLRAGGATEAEFTDSTFNLPIHHAKEVLRAILASPVRMRLHASGLNPLEADEELFDLMKRAGFSTLNITAESASDGALKGLGKGYGAREVRRMLRLALASKLDTFWYFLFGGPGETEATVEETLRFIGEEIPAHHLVFLGAGIRVQKGAPVESVARREGVVSANDDLLEPVFYFSPSMGRERLLARLEAEVKARPNCIQVVDYQSGRGPLMLSRLLHFLRIRRPNWAFVPLLNRTFGRLGRPRR